MREIVPYQAPDCNHFGELLKRHGPRVLPLNVIDNLDGGSLLPLSNSQPAVDNRFDSFDCPCVSEVLCPQDFLSGFPLV